MLPKNAKILVIDDDVDVLTAIRLLLKPLVKEVVAERNPNQIRSLLSKTKFDIIILDMNFNGLVNTGNEGIFWLRKIKESGSGASVILITAYADIDLAIRSLKEGAADFLIKPWKNEKLVGTITEILSKKSGNKSNLINPYLRSTNLLGESTAIKEVFVK